MKALQTNKKVEKNNDIDTLLVAFDSKHENLIIGRKDYRHNVDIINAFEGDEATKIYNELITRKDKEEQSNHESE